MKLTKETLLSYGKTLLMIALGSAIYSLGVNLFYEKAQLLSGGVTGYALLLHYKFGISTSLLIICFNVPMFILGWFFVSHEFVLLSLMGMGIFSGMLQLFSGWTLSFESPLTSVLLGGVLVGFGLGIILRTGASVGGTDIVGKIIHRYFSINMAVTDLALNVIAVLLSSMIFGLDQAVLTVCAMFIASKVTSFCLDGIDHRRAILIITDKKEELSAALMEQLARGVTIIDSYGAYTKKPNAMLYCVIHKQQLQKTKKIIKSVDPDAFFTIVMLTGVYGHGHSFIPFKDIEK